MRKISVDDILKMNILLYSFFKENGINPFDELLYFQTKKNIGSFYMEAALGWLKSNTPSPEFFNLGIDEYKVYSEEKEIENKKEELTQRKVLVKDFLTVNKNISNYILENEVNAEIPFYYSLDSVNWIKLTDYMFSLYNIYVNFKEPCEDFFNTSLEEIQTMSEFLLKKKTEPQTKQQMETAV